MSILTQTGPEHLKHGQHNIERTAEFTDIVGQRVLPHTRIERRCLLDIQEETAGQAPIKPRAIYEGTSMITSKR